MSTSSHKRERDMLQLIKDECEAVGGHFALRRKNGTHRLLDVWCAQGAGVICFTVSDVDGRAHKNFRRDVRNTLRNGKTRSQ